MNAVTSCTLRKVPLVLALSSIYAFGTAYAVPVVYDNTFTLATSNQSIYGSGAQPSWGYDSGFQGAQWGTYAGNSPVSTGVNAISGSDVCVWGGACVDTRTGAAINMSSSGRVGVDVTAQALGGSVSVTLPMSTQLTFGDKNSNGVFHVSGSQQVNTGGVIAATGPSFKAGVNGVINLDNSVSAEGCFIGAGCSTSSSDLNIDPGKFSLVGLDTTQTKPFSAFGLGLPVFKYGKQYDYRKDGSICAVGSSTDCVTTAGTPVSVTVGTPKLATFALDKPQDFSGGTLSGSTLSASHNETVTTVNADLTGILQSVLGSPVDILNPSINFGFASLNGSLLDAQAGVNLGLTQNLGFTPDLDVTLTFDVPVYELIGGHLVNQGNSVTFNLAEGADLSFNGADGHLLNWTYSMSGGNQFTSSFGLSIDPDFQISAACIDLELSLGLGGTGNQCAYSNTFNTTNLLDINVDSQDFALGGFDTASFSQDSPPGGNTTPEPGTLSLVGLAIAGMVQVERKRRERARRPSSP
jgi:hypothetical protein